MEKNKKSIVKKIKTQRNNKSGTIFIDQSGRSHEEMQREIEKNLSKSKIHLEYLKVLKNHKDIKSSLNFSRAELKTALDLSKEKDGLIESMKEKLESYSKRIKLLEAENKTKENAYKIEFEWFFKDLPPELNIEDKRELSLVIKTLYTCNKARNALINDIFEKIKLVFQKLYSREQDITEEEEKDNLILTYSQSLYHLLDHIEANKIKIRKYEQVKMRKKELESS